MPGVSDPPTFITINDPVAGVSYHLDTKAKVARKLAVAPDGMSFGIAGAPGIRATAGAHVAGLPVGAGAGPMISIRHEAGTQGAANRARSAGEPKTESLGKRGIDGVEAEGSRSTITIPAGEVGNEREIQIVTERWYSPELQTVVLSTHSDPRIGETKYMLTNLQRGEPHASLFQAPSDYTTVSDEGMPNVRVMRKIERK
jgi:hypothetical protein